LTTAAIEEDTVHCHNCGAAVDYLYCAVCGQETQVHVPSAREFLHEFITHYVALEGKLWQSLWLLVRKPGLLTADYLAGRRARYIAPLRLYLTFSILFFALFKWGGYEVVGDSDAPLSTSRQVQAGKSSGALTGKEGVLAAPAREAKKAERGEKAAKERAESGNFLQDQITRFTPAWAARIEKFETLSQAEKAKAYSTAFFSYAPYAMFCLMPLFAFYLKLLYLGTGRRYGEHLLFALHSNTFAYLMVGLIMAVPFFLAKTVLVIWLVLYLPFAMQRVYGGKRWLTFLRWLVVVSLHLMSLAAAVFSALVLAMIS
jgi:hypothetical protein